MLHWLVSNLFSNVCLKLCRIYSWHIVFVYCMAVSTSNIAFYVQDLCCVCNLTFYVAFVTNIVLWFCVIHMLLVSFLEITTCLVSRTILTSKFVYSRYTCQENKYLKSSYDLHIYNSIYTNTHSNLQTLQIYKSKRLKTTE